jgi:hypothetical protein
VARARPAPRPAELTLHSRSWLMLALHCAAIEPPTPLFAGAPPPQLHRIATRLSSLLSCRAAPELPLHGGRTFATVMGE